MLQRLLNLVPRGRFARRLAWISGGTFLGQLILLLAMPLLTRLFTPEDFGLFGVLGALSGIFGLIMAGRYEFAIPLAAKDEEAAEIVVLAGLVTVFLAVLSLVLVWTLGDAFAPGIAGLVVERTGSYALLGGLAFGTGLFCTIAMVLVLIRFDAQRRRASHSHSR